MVLPNGYAYGLNVSICRVDILLICRRCVIWLQKMMEKLFVLELSKNMSLTNYERHLLFNKDVKNNRLFA
jgi:hypothetical protein